MEHDRQEQEPPARETVLQIHIHVSIPLPPPSLLSATNPFLTSNWQIGYLRWRELFTFESIPSVSFLLLLHGTEQWEQNSATSCDRWLMAIISQVWKTMSDHVLWRCFSSVPLSKSSQEFNCESEPIARSWPIPIDHPSTDETGPSVPRLTHRVQGSVNWRTTAFKFYAIFRGITDTVFDRMICYF